MKKNKQKLRLEKNKLYPIERQFNLNNIEIERKITCVFINNHYNKQLELLKKLISLHIQLAGYFHLQAEVKKGLGLVYDENIVLNNTVFNHFYLSLSILELLKNGYYGSARVLLRQSFEMLMIAKYTEYDLKARIAWQNKDEIRMGNILSFIRDNGKETNKLQEIWKELCKYTHGTSSAQEFIRLVYVEDKEKLIEEIEKIHQITEFSPNLSYTFDLFFVSLNMLLECTPESRHQVKQQTLKGVKWEKHVENSAGNSKYPFSGI